MLGRVPVSILENIRGHEDLAALDDAQRNLLCKEIRTFLVDHVSKTGGHLASNLGVVELSVAIETVYNTQKDRLVFDVGHQSYVHKLLTGRQAGFSTLRQYRGMAGFPKPTESDTDAFTAGHASSSISVALGMARARTLMEEDYQVISVIGDGAATGGMVYEALNDAAESKEPLVVILNDNEMSIAKNVGGMAMHLSRLRTKAGYLGAKQRYRTVLKKIPFGSAIYRVTRKCKDWLRRVLIPATIFENMGVAYFGPVDGHDLPSLITLLRSAKEMGRPVVVHVLTEKGKGYEPAEKDPSLFHGVGKFNSDTGVIVPKGGSTFSNVLGEVLCSLAENNNKLCAITAAMPDGTGLTSFAARFPSRFFDVGIAEEHAVSMAAGLAKQGMIPVVAVYSTFLQRSYDMLMQDVGLQGLHAVFAVDRAGLVGEDGETHHGVYDVGFLRHVPGMRILCPASVSELKSMMQWAVAECGGPVAIRYPRGGDRGYSECAWPSDFAVHSEGSDCAIITYGVITEQVVKAACLLREAGICAAVVRLLTVSPLPVEQLYSALKGIKRVFVVEESASSAGIGSFLALKLMEKDALIQIRCFDLGEKYVPHGKVHELYRHCGVDAESLKGKIMEVFACED